MNILNKSVSCYQNKTSSLAPKPVNLLTWLRSRKYEWNVQQLRASQNPKAWKSTLPCVTISGTFTGKTQNTIKSYTALIALDFDKVGDCAALKSYLSTLPFVAYAGLSCSGTGIFCIVPLSESVENFPFHFLSLVEFFEDKGLTLDKSCSDLVRFRFYSIDDEAYYNHNAIPYLGLSYPSQNHHSNGFGNKYDQVEMQLQSIETQNIDIAENYKGWTVLGAAFYHEFGEDGFPFFQRVSALRPIDSKAANAQNVLAQWKWCKRMNKVSINTFFHYTQKHIKQ